MENNSTDKHTRELDNFFNSLYDEIFNSPEDEIKEMLRDLNYDPDTVGNKSWIQIKKITSRMAIAQKKNNVIEQLKKAREKMSALGNTFSEKDRNVLARIMAGSDEAAVAVCFNKIKSLPKEDILSMLKDTQLLEFIEQTEDQKSK